MADIVDKKTRSRMMSGIRGSNTKPELIVRAIFARLRYKPEINCRELIGKPDIVLRRKKVAVFVHGCFWHGHDCHFFKWPSTRTCFWRNKIVGNRRNDKKVIEALKKEGWRVLVIWECAFKGIKKVSSEGLLTKIRAFLLNKRKFFEVGEIK